MHLQKVIERLRRKRARKIFGEASVASCAHARVEIALSSQAPKEKIMAQHVRFFNALSPSDKQGWDTTVGGLVRARSRHRAAQSGRDQLAHFDGSSRTRGVWLDAACQQSLFQKNDGAELFRLWQIAVFSRPSVESLRRKFFVSSRSPQKGSARRAQRSPLLCRCGSVPKLNVPWLPSLCWNRDAFHDAALLVCSKEGAQALYVVFVYMTNQTALFLPLRRFLLAVLALTCVSGKEALNAWENHNEFMFEYDQVTYW